MSAAIWITTQEATDVTGIPGRTLRDQAIKQKIRCEKHSDGTWKYELRNLKEQGKIPKDRSEKFQELVEKYSLAERKTEDKTQEPQQSEENTNESDLSKKQGRKKKYRSDLKSLGIYKDLLDFYQSNFFIEQKLQEIKKSIFDSLVGIGIGYYEFHSTIKAESYRAARKHLIRALVNLHAIENKDEPHPKEAYEKLSQLLSSVNGLIRNIERSYNKSDKKQRSYPARDEMREKSS